MEQEEKTSRDAKVYHDKYFYFDFEGKEYRGCWYTVGFSYAGLRVWKKQGRNFGLLNETVGNVSLRMFLNLVKEI